MNRKEKDWIFAKIDTLREISEGINNTIESLREISEGINNTIEYRHIHLCNAMVLWLNIFIKEIHEKIGVK